MTAPSTAMDVQANTLLLRKAVEITIRLAALAVLVAWCFIIFQPFVLPILWAMVIGVALFPAFVRVRSLLGGRSGIAAAGFVLVGLALVIVPTWQFAGSTIEGIRSLSEQIETGSFTVPPPSERVKTWPVVGERLHATWTEAAADLESTLDTLAPQLRQLGVKALDLLRGLGGGVLHTIIAIIIAGFMLAHAEGSKKAMVAISTRLAGERGEEIITLGAKTIRSVALGVLGVAFIQALLGGAGLLFAGVPAPGIWVLLILILAVMQLPPLLVLGPIAFYVFSANDSTTVAVVFAIWSAIVSVSDGFLKPMFLGRGVDVPMPVILIGAIGGMIAHGILGLFVGAIVLAMGYSMYRAWMAAGSDPVSAISGSDFSPQGSG